MSHFFVQNSLWLAAISSCERRRLLSLSTLVISVGCKSLYRLTSSHSARSTESEVRKVKQSEPR